MNDTERFCADLDAWMRYRLGEGSYPEMGDEMVTGWTLFLDRYDQNDPDAPWTWSVLHPPGQNVALSVGHGHMIVKIKSAVE